MDDCTTLLARRAADTPAPALLLPLIEKIRKAVTTVMQLTGTSPLKEKLTETVSPPPPAEATAAPVPAPEKADPVPPPVPEETAAPVQTTAPTGSEAPRPPDPPELPPMIVPTSSVQRTQAAAFPRPPAKSHGKYAGYRRPVSSPAAWQNNDAEERRIFWDIAQENKRDFERRKALMPWLKEKFAALLQLPRVQRRVQDMGYATEAEALGFEIARYRKWLTRPTLKTLRGSPVERMLKQHGLSLSSLCFAELPNAIANFNPTNHEGNGATFERHIRDHLCTHIEQTLQRLRASDSE